MTVGERMRARRKEIGISAEKVAESLDVSPATIYRYENGDIEKLPTTLLTPVAKALKTSEAYLLGWTSDSSEDPFIGLTGVESLPVKYKKLNESIVPIGYEILKVKGEYYFIHPNGFNAVSESSLDILVREPSESLAEACQNLCQSFLMENFKKDLSDGEARYINTELQKHVAKLNKQGQSMILRFAQDLVASGAYKNNESEEDDRVTPWAASSGNISGKRDADVAAAFKRMREAFKPYAEHSKDKKEEE